MASSKFINSLVLASAILSLILGVYTIVEQFSIVLIITIGIISISLIIGFLFLRNKEPYEFEIIEQKITLDIKDSKGKEVNYINRSKLRCLKKNSFHFLYSIFSDGIIEEIEVSPGSINTTYYENGSLMIQSSLGRNLNKGEIVSFPLNSSIQK